MQSTLSDDDAFALVAILLGKRRKVRSSGGGHRFLYLQEQRIVISNAEKQHQIGPGADRTNADDTVCHIFNMIAAEHHPPLRRQSERITIQHLDDFLFLLRRNGGKNGRIVSETPSSVAGPIGDLG